MNEWIISHEKRKPKTSYAVACLTQVIWAELGACKERRKIKWKKSHHAKFRIENQEKLFYSFMAIDFVILDYHAIAIM